MLFFFDNTICSVLPVDKHWINWVLFFNFCFQKSLKSVLSKAFHMKVTILNNIAKSGLDILEKEGFTLHQNDVLDGCSGIVLRSQNLTQEKLPKSIFGIARAGAGTNNINVEDCSQNGVIVFNTPGANANAVKEMVLCSLILGKRDLVSGNKSIDAIDIDNMDDEAVMKEIEAMKKKYVGNEIKNKNLTVIGLGAIGSLVAEHAIQLGMNVTGYDPGLTVETALRLPSSIRMAKSLEDSFKDAEYISLHIPLVPDTKEIINNKLIAKLNKSVLINFSRGGIVCEESLLEGLDQNFLYKYVTDFPTKKLINRVRSKKDVVIFPHLGASTTESEINCAEMACSQLADFLKKGKIVNSVNFPNISSEKVSKHRIYFSNMNEPGIISKVADVLAQENINIDEFVNKSRNNLASNIIDSDDDITPRVLDKLMKIKGVTNARLCY